MTERAAEAQAWMDTRADEMAELVMTLVAIDTTNPPGRNLATCANALRDAMARLDIAAEIVPVTPTAAQQDPCIVRATVGEGDRLLYFHGHFDVVPAQRPDQFIPERRDGSIHGRGTADMKGGLVSMIYGAAAARDLGLLGDGRIVLHLVCDEETGSTAGSGHLRAENLIDPAALAMLTPEPSGGRVWHAARSAVSLRVTVSGREAHVGQAHLGENAFLHMARVATRLELYAAERMAETTTMPLDATDHPGSMVVVGGMTGSGANFNVVPGSAWFTVDCRFNPEVDIDAELHRLRGIIADAASACGAEASVEVTQFQPAAATRVDHPAALALARSVAAAGAPEARFEMCPGVLEIRWYAQLGIPAFAYGAGRLDVSHGPAEWIDEAEMHHCATVYALYAADLLRR